MVYNRQPESLRIRMLEYDEKRRFARMEADCKISYRLAGDESYHDGGCVNISGAGILFRGDFPLEVGKAAELRIDPENGITPPLIAYIEVVRCEADANGSYRIAGSIKGIKSE
jgi:hypothetical protein